MKKKYHGNEKTGRALQAEVRHGTILIDDCKTTQTKTQGMFGVLKGRRVDAGALRLELPLGRTQQILKTLHSAEMSQRGRDRARARQAPQSSEVDLE